MAGGPGGERLEERPHLTGRRQALERIRNRDGLVGFGGGQRIGLMIFSSDNDFTLWPKPGTELTVELGATSIELPVVGGPRALRRATTPKRRRLSAPRKPIFHPLPGTNGSGRF